MSFNHYCHKNLKSSYSLKKKISPTHGIFIKTIFLIFNVDLKKHADRDSLSVTKAVHPDFIIYDVYNLKCLCMLLKMPERFLPQKMLICVIHTSVSEDIRLLLGKSKRKTVTTKTSVGIWLQ